MNDFITSSLLRLADSLPQGYRDLGTGYGDTHAEFDISYNAGADLWEIEYCCLDGNKNFAGSADSLNKLLQYAITKLEPKHLKHLS
jgi:hypothetical protein